LLGIGVIYVIGGVIMCIFSYVNKVEYLGGVKRKRANPRGVALGRHDNTADIRN
jgi:hypothetical protein